MKKTYKTKIHVSQKTAYGDDWPEITFEFLDDIMTARQFSVMLDEALSQAGKPFRIDLKETISYEE